MGNINPLQMLLMLRGGNPQQVAEQLINQNYSNDPNMMGLLELARKGDIQSLTNIAQKMTGGANIAQEIQKLQSSVKNL